jgi:hypothetical protein
MSLITIITGRNTTFNTLSIGKGILMQTTHGNLQDKFTPHDSLQHTTEGTP